jgi:hypothetical protein
MSNIIQFNYNRFYKYYTKNTNLETERSSFNKTVWYYNDLPHHTNQPIETNLSHKYIRIHNTKIYIKKHNNGLLFTIPTEIGDKLWDFHYHFGKTFINDSKSNTNNKNVSIPVVYFHKTIQNPIENGKDIINCYYHTKTDIDLNTFEDMKCLQRDYYMRQLYTPEDFVFIKEIISRPFINQTAGKSRKTRRNRKRRIRKTNRFIQKKKNNI